MSRLPRRGALLAASIGAVALAAPAGATAAAPVLTTKPIKATKGYSLSLSASTAFVSAALSKTSGGETQTHGINSAGKVSYSANGSLTKASVKTSFGPWGAVNMTFRGTGKLRDIKPARGCTQKVHAKSRSGVLSGSFKAVIGSGLSYQRRSFSATLTSTGSTIRCKGSGNGGAAGHSWTLSSTGDGGLSLVAFEGKTSGPATITASVSENNGKAFRSHSIFASEKRSLFHVSSDLQSAHLGTVGPWLSGAVDYAATPGGPSLPGVGSKSTSGSLTGSITAKFDFIGAKTLSDGSFGSLSEF